MNKLIRNSLLLLLTLIASAMLIRYFTSTKTAVTIADSSAFRSTLKDSDDFNALSAKPLSAKYSGVKTVKVVYDLHTRKLYFIDGNRFTYHFEFCRDVLGYTQGLKNFNHSNYSNTSQRDYVLANLNFYTDLQTYAVEFVTEDDVQAGQVLALFAAITRHSYLKNHLRLLINGAYLEKLQTSLHGIALISPDEIYGGLQYQLIKEGTAYGKLAFVNNALCATADLSDCIIVLTGTPLLIPACQGIITDQFQTPLSHIQILAHQNKIPAFAFKKIQDTTYQKYAGKWVKITAGSDRFDLKEVKRADYLQYKKKATATLVRLKYDTHSPELMLTTECVKGDELKIGHKASHFANLVKIAGLHPTLFSVPEGSFAIPFYYYQQHISRPAINTQLQMICKDHRRWTPEQLARELKTLRHLIRQQPVNDSLLQLAEQQILSNQVGYSYRFRSSCNAEDAEGFSGAGLYKSSTGVYGVQQKSIEQAIQKVWASTWSLQAFKAREQAGIRQDDVKMGILCHKNFGNEDANGVVVTSNLYRPSFAGYTANVQSGELSVVKPDAEVICDQFTFFEASAFNDGQAPVAVDYINIGNQLGGRKVLTQAQITQLYKAVHACVTYYQRTLFSPHTFDIEFKFLQGKLYLKQIRPYEQ